MRTLWFSIISLLVYHSFCDNTFLALALHAGLLAMRHCFQLSLVNSFGHDLLTQWFNVLVDCFLGRFFFLGFCMRLFCTYLFRRCLRGHSRRQVLNVLLFDANLVRGPHHTINELCLAFNRRLIGFCLWAQAKSMGCGFLNPHRIYQIIT